MEVQTKLNMIEKSKLKSQKNIAAIYKKPNIRGIYKSYHLTKDIDNKKDLIRFKENTNFFTTKKITNFLLYTKKIILLQVKILSFTMKIKLFPLNKELANIIPDI